MDPRPTTPTCVWPHCADHDDNCYVGLSMPCTIVHPTFDGENLERARFAAHRPFFATPRESALIVLVTLIAIGWALYAANAAQGVPV